MAALLGSGAPDDSRALDTLVAAHLVNRPAPGRYGMHDLIRLCAREHADADADTDYRAGRLRMFDWYVRTADAACRRLEPHRPHRDRPVLAGRVRPLGFASDADALAWFDSERINLVLATRAAATDDCPTVVWQLADSMFGFYMRRHHVADWVETYRRGADAARLLGDRQAEVLMCNGLAVAYSTVSRFTDAAGWYERALVLNEEIGDRCGAAVVAANLGTQHTEAGDPNRAIELLIRAVATFRDLGERSPEGICLGNLGRAHRRRGDLAAARSHLVAALDIATETGKRGKRVQRRRGDRRRRPRLEPAGPRPPSLRAGLGTRRHRGPAPQRGPDS